MDDGSVKRIKQVNFLPLEKSTEVQKLTIGDHAVLYGLSVSNVLYNGCTGMIASNTVEKQNQVLMDDGSVKSINPENICVIPKRTGAKLYNIPNSAIFEEIIKSDKLVVINFT